MGRTAAESTAALRTVARPMELELGYVSQSGGHRCHEWRFVA